MVPAALREALARLESGDHLEVALARDAVDGLLSADLDPMSASAFLIALHRNGVSPAELDGAVIAVQARMIPLDVPDSLRPLLDTCGTGGDGANSVNISTAAALVVAACGVRVAKHGNRSASGNSGSSDVLHQLGVKHDAEPAVLVRCLEDAGIAFLFAPRFHPALKGLAPIRKALPHRTIFNMIGPLVNPVWPDAQVVGVADRAQALLLSSLLEGAETGPRHAEWDRRFRLEATLKMDISWVGDAPPEFRSFVVTGEDGLDEVTLGGTTTVLATVGRTRSEIAWRPGDFGLPTTPAAGLIVSGPEDSAVKILEMLSGERGPVRDVVLANAAAALMLVGKAASLAEGVSIGAEAIDRGDAARLLAKWAALSHA